MDKYSIFFMTEGDGFSISLKPANDDSWGLYLELLSCFGDIQESDLKISAEQQATFELKSKISSFVDLHGETQPILKRLKSNLLKLPDDQYFLILPELPSDTFSTLNFEVYLSTLNEVESIERVKETFEKKMKVYEHASDFLKKYDIHIPNNDTRTIIGNTKKSSRVCRFCTKTEVDGATFKKIAHAIPEGLGNKHIILGDECDSCNEYFGNEVEPALIEHLDIYRVFLGVKGKKGTPKLKYKNGQMHNTEGMSVVMSQNIEKISDKEIKVSFDSTKKFTPVKLYKALCKITLSTIDETHISNLKETIKWLKDSSSEEVKLPRVAVNVVHGGFSKKPQIVNYIRKVDSDNIPHIVSEFRIGSFVYVYILPFNSKDYQDFSNPDNYEKFWSTFTHYNGDEGWRFDCFDNIKEVAIKEIIRMVETGKA